MVRILDFLLPPKQAIGLDANGIKKLIEYKFSGDGNKVKITTTKRIRKLANAHLSNTLSSAARGPSSAMRYTRLLAAVSPWSPLKRFSLNGYAPLVLRTTH